MVSASSTIDAATTRPTANTRSRRPPNEHVAGGLDQRLRLGQSREAQAPIVNAAAGTETPHRLLEAFRRTFEGVRYRHRQSHLGDFIAMHLYEDLVELGRSAKLVERVVLHERLLNTANRRIGIEARRGDGTFGEAIPGSAGIEDPGYLVARGPVATVEIGVEVKILFKAMLKQVDRVMNDLRGQAIHFRHHGGHPICVGIVGVNFAPECTSYEGGDRSYPTDGKKYKHPIQEASEAEERVRRELGQVLDELLILRFRATNTDPYPFEWVAYSETLLAYGAALTRISRKYDQEF